jgi:hypothetical protein
MNSFDASLATPWVQSVGTEVQNSCGLLGSDRTVSTRHDVIGEEISRVMPVGETRGGLRRIEKRASLELKAAIDAAIVSLRKADELIYQMPAKQHAYFTVRQAGAEAKQCCCQQRAAGLRSSYRRKICLNILETQYTMIVFEVPYEWVSSVSRKTRRAGLETGRLLRQQTVRQSADADQSP